MSGSILGGSKGATRSLDYSPYRCREIWGLSGDAMNHIVGNVLR